MKPIQWKAVDLLAAGSTQEKTAAECNVWPSTVRRWLKRAEFHDALQNEVLKLRERQRAQFSTFWVTRAKASADEHVPRISAQISAT